ncbi:MAG: UDP-N-acetylmuramoyl-tripeptide--D-alanyl-D-alanine ligase [Bacteroidia bacterium]|nr:UDP-N-acetylmuramoyl-tripeptide--D-alanyl-D-alanine ligase [Bacteroidia bacterium]
MEIRELYDRYLECGGRVSTDTRTLKGGEMFIALKGENFDGNAYAGAALDAGAACAVVDEDSAAARSGDGRIIAVEDSFAALQELASWHREHCESSDGGRVTVLGLTGTNGKTTTKELIARVLSTTVETVATEGNLNNDIGVPLSLLKIRKGTRIAVIEMGANHPDDISKLVRVCRPDFGLITNVGKAHLLGFGSFEGVQRAKGQLYDYLSAHGGSIFLNADDEVLRSMVSARKGLPAILYGVRHDGVKLLQATDSEPLMSFRIGDRTVRTRLSGAYNLANALAALCVGRHFSVPLDAAVGAVESYTPSNNRSQMQRSPRGNLLILDAYNANPSSIAAALENLLQFRSGRRVALLGDMRELGEDSLKEHSALVRRIAASPFEAYLVGGEFRKALSAEGLPANVKGIFATSSELAEHLSAHPLSDAVVLVKGSRGIQMEKTVPVL